MAIGWKVVMDAADPNAQAAFWAAALEYVVEDNSAIVSRLHLASSSQDVPRPDVYYASQRGLGSHR